MLEYPLKPLWHIHFVGCWCSIFPVIFISICYFYSVCRALGQTCSFASFGLCVGLCGLQMCMAAKGWLIYLLSLSYRYSFVIQISLETDKRISDCRYVAKFFFSVCNGVIFQNKQVTNFGVVQFVNALFYILAQNEV